MLAYLFLFVIIICLMMPLIGWTTTQIYDWKLEQQDLEQRGLPGPDRTLIGHLLAAGARNTEKLTEELKRLWDSLNEESTIQSDHSSYRPSRDWSSSTSTALPRARGREAFEQIISHFSDQRAMTPGSYWSQSVAAPLESVNLKALNDRSYKLNLDGTEIEVIRRQLGYVSIACLKCQWPDQTFRIKIFEETLSESEKRFQGLQDIVIGDRTFDKTYMVQSNDEHVLRKLLNAESRTALLGIGKSINFTISGGQVMLEFLHAFDSYADGREIINAVLKFKALYEAFARTDNQTVFVAVQSHVNQTNANCMVCGQTIESQPVTCQRCKTGHHPECWEYLGKCSTFACGGTELDQ